MGYYGGGMMGGYAHHVGGGSSFLCSLLMIVVIIDLVLIGMWLWKRIKREDMKLCGSCSMKGVCGACGTKPCACTIKKEETTKSE